MSIQDVDHYTLQQIVSSVVGVKLVSITADHIMSRQGLEPYALQQIV